MFRSLAYLIALAVFISVTACAPTSTPTNVPQVLAVESFLADIAQNVAGNRLKVDTLIPLGTDPHGFEPTPADVRRVADSQVLIVNGAGLEEFLEKLLANAGGKRLVIEAAAGLKSRETQPGEKVETRAEHHHEGDPHFWLDPNNVIKYVENIRDGLSQADPAGAATYRANADAYIAQLKQLDAWIVEQVKMIPPERRLLVTNHVSFGYFADRYGFKIIGTILPSASTGTAPSAQQLAALVNQIKTHKAKAIFLETGTNPQLAKQIAQETGIQVIVGLHTHSLTDAKGSAPTYIEMIKSNVKTIVDALK
ncbi:MAG: metal ABC transporter substrate-binding protein [Anaerolineae bacterium]|nr:metal ABC transporter substrate-binding protein [Anaerolineae bacterium]